MAREEDGWARNELSLPRHRADRRSWTRPAGRRSADLALTVVRSDGIAETNETYAVRLMSSLIHGYITLEIAGTFAHSEPSSESTWPEVLEDLDRTLARIAASPRG